MKFIIVHFSPYSVFLPFRSNLKFCYFKNSANYNSVGACLITGKHATKTVVLSKPGALSLGVKRAGRETAEVKERVELYLHSPNKPSWSSA